MGAFQPRLAEPTRSGVCHRAAQQAEVRLIEKLKDSYAQGGLAAVMRPQSTLASHHELHAASSGTIAKEKAINADST
jgi:hypothetical protein